MSIVAPSPSSPLSIYTSSSHELSLSLNILNTSTAAFPEEGSSNVFPFPPPYESIKTPSLSALAAAGASTSAVGGAGLVASGPEAIASRNREKQALRDRYAREEEQASLRSGQLAPRSNPSRSHSGGASSIETQSTASLSPRDEDGSPIPTLASPETTPTNSYAPIALIPSSGSGSSGSRHSAFSFGRQAILPEGMSVREALAQCQDPALGWSLQFWITIADPVNQHVFYACPATGQTSWSPPEGVFVVPRQADGEWWELADASRKNRSYFYNTLTKKTQWTRPGADHFVIPLGLIQRSTLPPPSTPISPAPGSVAFPIASPAPVPQNRSPPRTPPKESASLPLLPPSQTDSRFPSPNRLARPALPTLASLSTVSEVSGTGSDWSDRSLLKPKRGLSLSRWKRRSSSAVASKAGAKDDEYPDDGYRSPEEVPAAVTYDGPFATVLETQSGPHRISEEVMIDGKAAELPQTPSEEPVYVDPSPKRTSFGSLPSVPPDPITAAQIFQTEEEFSTRYFATRREGLMRQKVPFTRVMSWQSAPLPAPLLVASAPLAKEAVAVFKVIQHVMGERDRPVEQARITTGEDKPRATTLGPMDSTEQKMIVLEEVRWVLYMAVMNVDFQDEVYIQLIKQLSGNGDHDAVVLGFQLFCVLVNSFGPNKPFEHYIKNFLLDNVGIKSDGIGIMAKYCLNKLKRWIVLGGRGRTLSIGEIENASDAAFYPSVFGESLDRVMELQKSSYPNLKVPVILPFLADGILALGGLEAEGIFRIPGDADSVADLKSRMDRGHYQLKGIENAHIAASLFKLWLRELEEPIVPPGMYNDALVASKSPEDAQEFVKTLPNYQRRVLLFVISFLQKFINDHVVEKTKMTPTNLALVLAPNILRTTSDSLVTVYTNSSFESKFVLQLLEHLDPATVDPEYVPKHIQIEGVV